VRQSERKHLEGSRIIYKPEVVTKHPVIPCFPQNGFKATVSRCKEAGAVLLSLNATQLIKYATYNKEI